MDAPTFVITVSHRGPMRDGRRRKSGRRKLMDRRRVVHRPECRYASLARISYPVDLAAVERLLDRALRGNDDGRTVFCATCEPSRLLGLYADIT